MMPCRIDDYSRVLRVLGRPDEAVRFCVRCGSHVYGTARDGSDQDFLVVLTDLAARQDLLWGENTNIVVHGAGSYASALEAQSVFALEGFFAPAEHRLKEAHPPFAYRPNARRLFEAAKARSDSDWAKARKRYDEEPEASRKRAVHGLRVLAFAAQIVEHGAIVDFQAAVSWWECVSGREYLRWEELAADLEPVRAGLLARLEKG